MTTSPIPHLHELQNKLDELSRNGYDVHTVKFITNGGVGGWDVRIEATDDALEDHCWDLHMNDFGYDLEPARAVA